MQNEWKSQRDEGERYKGKERDRHTERQIELENIFYEDCSLGSVKNPTTVLAMLLTVKIIIQCIIYIQISMNEIEILYMKNYMWGIRTSTACSQRYMHISVYHPFLHVGAYNQQIRR